jgi:hypothetical protein
MIIKLRYQALDLGMFEKDLLLFWILILVRSYKLVMLNLFQHLVIEIPKQVRNDTKSPGGVAGVSPAERVAENATGG